jgi:TolA-binding protein
MKRELKKQIKQDELMTGFAQAVVWTREHQREARTGALVLVLLVAVSYGLYYYRSQRTQAGMTAFAAAVETYHAPVTGTPEATEQPGVTSYPSKAEKMKKAASAFDDVAKRYGSLPVGRRARYYAALCRAETGDLPQAEKELNELALQRDAEALEPSLARLALADVQRRSGQLDKAIQTYRQAVEDQTFRLPHDYALMQLASTLEEARRPDEASASYRRLTEEFPASVYASEARQRAAYLSTAQG